MITNQLLGKRELKNIENKKKLIEATTHLLHKYNYNTLTIRNLCKKSGVAYGSFYNLFESKERFLVYYLTSDFVNYKKEYYSSHKEFSNLSVIDKTIDVFICCGKYNQERGIEFISSFYSSNNYSLFPISDNNEDYYSFTPIVNEIQEYIKKAIDMGIIKKSVNINSITERLCFLFNGITFNWCISKGTISMTQEINWLLNLYIDSIRR